MSEPMMSRPIDNNTICVSHTNEPSSYPNTSYYQHINAEPTQYYPNNYRTNYNHTNNHNHNQKQYHTNLNYQKQLQTQSQYQQMDSSYNLLPNSDYEKGSMSSLYSNSQSNLYALASRSGPINYSNSSIQFNNSNNNYNHSQYQQYQQYSRNQQNQQNQQHQHHPIQQQPRKQLQIDASNSRYEMHQYRHQNQKLKIDAHNKNINNNNAYLMPMDQVLPGHESDVSEEYEGGYSREQTPQTIHTQQSYRSDCSDNSHNSGISEATPPMPHVHNQNNTTLTTSNSKNIQIQDNNNNNDDDVIKNTNPQSRPQSQPQSQQHSMSISPEAKVTEIDTVNVNPQPQAEIKQEEIKGECGEDVQEKHVSKQQKQKQKQKQKGINTKDLVSEQPNGIILHNRRYIKHQKLANTLQGDLCLFVDNHQKNVVVIKRTNKKLHKLSLGLENQKVDENIIKEARTLKYISMHPEAPIGFVRFVDFFEDSESCYLVQDYGGSELFDYVVDENKKVQNGQLAVNVWNKRVQYLAQHIGRVLYYLHYYCNLCHLDVSLENTLIGMLKNDKTGQIVDMVPRIIDFGLAETFPNRNFTCNKFVGKKQYKAPKVWYQQTFDARKADVWSFGIMLFMMIVCVPPFKEPNKNVPELQYIIRGKMKEVLKHWKLDHRMPDDALDLLNHMLTSENERYTMEQVMNHPFMRTAPTTFEEIRDGLDIPTFVGNQQQ